MTNRLYPIFLKLEGRLCGVVGGGAVAARKIESLIECGAKVRVITPQAVAEIESLARQGRIEWIQRGFAPGDLDGMALVVSATDDAEVNRAVYREANERGIFCNVVDQPDLCDFYVPAVVRRGDLKIAVSTGGRSPELAKAIRALLERQIGGEFARAIEEAGRLRDALREKMPDDSGGRSRILREKLKSEELIDALDRDDCETADAIIESWKSFLSD